MLIAQLISNLALADETQRSNAAEDLGYAGTAEAVASLLSHLPTEPSRKVRETIFSALARIDHPAVINGAADLLSSEDAFLRNEAVSLLRLKGSAAVETLLARMHDPDVDVRKFVLDVAAVIASPDTGPLYAAALHDPDVNIQITALESIAELRLHAFKTNVEQIFGRAKQSMLICAAFGALLQIGDRASWQAIRWRYPKPETVPAWKIGWWTRALGQFGDASEIEVFHQILRHHDGKVFVDTLDALELFQERHGALPISEPFWLLLRGVLDLPITVECQLQLCRVLGGFSAPPAVADHLLDLLKNGHRLGKLAAIEGLSRVKRADVRPQLQLQLGVETDPEVRDALAAAMEATS